jgi:hypothetical protein
MPQYMDPLIRSGAMWSCERQAVVKPRRGLWARISTWLGISRGPTSSRPLIFRSNLLRQGKPPY